MRKITFLVAILVALIAGVKSSLAADVGQNAKFHTRTIYNPVPVNFEIK